MTPSPLPFVRFVPPRYQHRASACTSILARSMLSDPASAAWVASGRPNVDAPAPVAGICGRCGQDGPTVTSSRIISEKFTGFDDWPFGSRRLCTPCAWAYSQPPSSQPPLLITTTTLTEYTNAWDLSAVLTNGPLPVNHAVVVSVARRRHILPTAQWGHLATDALVIPWDAAAAERLTSLVWLRTTLEATWPQLERPAPPARLLTTQPAERWQPIMAAWTSLKPWRSIPPLWDAARLITHVPTT